MNTTGFQGRVAIVAGGASGIGYEAAKLLVSAGATCIIWDINSVLGCRAAESLSSSGKVIYQYLDVTDDKSIADASSRVLREFGNPEILVYSVGIIEPKITLWDIDPALWQRVVTTNLFGCFFVCRHVVPRMIGVSRGRIVIVASVAGKDGSPRASAYSASKAGVIALAKSLGKELAPYGILVNSVTPASTMTPLFASEDESDRVRQIGKIPLGRAARPEEVAQLIFWLCSPDCSFSTSAVFDISGGRSVY